MITNQINMIANVKHESKFYTYVELFYMYMYYSRSGPFDIHVDKCSDNVWLDMVVVLNMTY